MQNLPPRYVPPPVPSTSKTEKDIQNLTAKFNEMQDEYEIGKNDKVDKL